MDPKLKERIIRIVFIVAGWSSLIVLTHNSPVDYTNPLFIFAAIAIIAANCFPLDIRVAQITQAFAFEYLVMMMLGPVSAAWISVIGIIGQGITSKYKRLEWYLLNTSIQAFAIICAGIVFFKLGGATLISSRENLVSPGSLIPVFAGAITHFIVNIGAVYPLILVRHGKNLNYQDLWNVFQWDFLAKLVFAPLAYYIFVVYGESGIKQLIAPVAFMIFMWIFIRKSIELSVAKRKLSEHLKRIQSQHEIARAANSSLDIQQVITTITQKVKDLYNCELSAVHIINKSGHFELPIKIANNTFVCCDFTQSSRFKKVLEWVLRTSKPFISGKAATIRKLTDETRKNGCTSCEIKSIAVYPVMIDKRQIGTITFCSKDANHFDNIAKEMIEFISHELSGAISNAQLHQDLRKAYDERSEELAIAAAIQRNVLPTDYMTERVRIGTHFSAAKVLGGDFYEIAPRGDRLIAIGVGDVSGKGVPAALTMMRIITVLRKVCRESRSSLDVLNALNKELNWEKIENANTNQYATCFFILLDPSNGLIRYSCAGHVKPFLYRKETDDVISLGTDGGFPLGMFKDGNYNEEKVMLSPGDKVILYTDGAIDAVNNEGQRFSISRLEKSVMEVCSDDNEDTAYGIYQKIMEFRQDAQLIDDIAIVSIEYLGGPIDDLDKLKAVVGKNLTVPLHLN
jgi:serine phosphatase RsbU (regulator of sigma subunit)